MITNFVQLAMQYLTPTLLSKIGGALGLSNESAKAATEASVPALLAGLAGVASKPGGASRLDSALQEQDPGLLDNLTAMLGGGSSQQSLINKGSGLLSSLFGGSGMNGLIGAVAKFAGIGDGAAKSMLGILGPVVMGILGREKKRAGLDASELALMLTNQKDSFKQAMPARFANLLGDTDLLEDMPATATSVTSSTPIPPPHTPVRNIETPAYSAPAAKSSPRWLFWLIPLIVVAALAWLFLGDRGQQVAEQVKETTTDTIEAAKNLTVGDVDLGAQVKSLFGSAEETLGSITDVNSARSALPKLQEMVGQLDNLGVLAEQLPTEARQLFSNIVASAVPVLDQLIDKAQEIPGVSEIIGPTLDTLKTKLNALI